MVSKNRFKKANFEIYRNRVRNIARTRNCLENILKVGKVKKKKKGAGKMKRVRSTVLNFFDIRKVSPEKKTTHFNWRK